MPSVPSEASSDRPGYLFELSVIAVGLWVGFRFGLVPGGQVGIDVLLAVAGWWAGVAALAPSARPLWGRAFRALWLSAVAVLVLAVAWVLTTDSTAADRLVRGQALALTGGYGNWHLLAFGPGELRGDRLVTPLQHLWPWAVLAQVLLVWAVVVAVVRRCTAPDQARGFWLACTASALAVLGLAATAVVSAGGASLEAVTLSTAGRAPSFLLGAALAVSGDGGFGDRIQRGARRWFSVPVLVLLALAAVAEPTEDLWRYVGALASAPFAALAVAAAAPRPGRELDDQRVRSEWAALGSFVVVSGAVFTLAATDRTDAVGGAQRFGALLVAMALAAVMGWVAERLSSAPRAVERRRVLVPALVATLLLAVMSVTGAFHWQGVSPRGEVAPEVEGG